MGRRFAVHAGAHRQALIAIALAGTAFAAPKGKAARAAFDEGVAAYKKSDYAAASTAFGKANALETDVETLFAWAQAERKLGHCDKASELYVKLLATKMPAENKQVVRTQLEECKKQIADDQAQAKIEADARAKADADAKAKADAQAKTDADAARAGVATPTPTPTPAPVPDVRVGVTPAQHRPWFTDALGDTLVVAGIVGVGVGAAMWASASSAASANAGDYATAKANDDKAKSRGTIGTVAGIAGVALIAAGIIRYATRSDESPTLTTWIDPHGSAGLAIAGGF